jgi:amino acid permease
LDNLVKHTRSPLGALIALAIIFAAVVITAIACHVLYGVGAYVFIAAFLLAVVALAIWIIKRTPKTRQGLVATEDYYAFERYMDYLEHKEPYGTTGQVETRQEILKKRKTRKDQLLTPPGQLKLPNGETH